jgi:hypothetical protein
VGEPVDLDVLRGAVELAAGQGATLFELRARTDLCSHGADGADREALVRLLDGLADGDGLDEFAAARAVLAQA